MAKDRKLLRAMPENLAAEACVIGSMIINYRCIGDVMALVAEDDFYHTEHRILYRTLREMYDSETPTAIDGVTVRARLEQNKQLDPIGGLDYLRRVVESVPSAANAVYYAGIVKEASKRRILIQTATDLAEAGYDTSRDINESLSEAESRLFSAVDTKGGETYEADRVLMGVIEEIEKREGTQVTGLGTGYYALDEMLSGFHAGELIVLAARPSIGKTALAMNIAVQAVMNEKVPVHVFSLEMSKSALLERVIASEAPVDGQKLRKGMLGPMEYQKMIELAARFRNAATLFVDDSSYLTPFELRSKARRTKRDGGTGLIIVDYLQLMAPGRRIENRQQEITWISGQLKGLARELEVPVLVLSQLNRGPEAREDHRPRLSDLRESGSIEQDADVVMMLYRADYYGRQDPDYTPDGKAEVIVAKQRNGPTGTVTLTFLSKYVRFENLAELFGQEEPY